MNRYTTTPKRANPFLTRPYFRWACKRSGNNRTKKSQPGAIPRPGKTSFKCGCSFYITATHPLLSDNSGVDKSSVVIVNLNLEHDNGCSGNDDFMNKLIDKRNGRRYDDNALSHLRSEVKAGRYTTHDVKSWLGDQGMKDATLREATNLRYRLIRDIPIKGYNPKEVDERDIGQMQDFLFNEDLAAEVIAGGQKSIDNMRIVHNGLKRQVKGYDYQVATDSENRFTATGWQTGRMRNRMRRWGVLIFLDDSRSGINTSGFSFWNVMIVDHEYCPQVGMGAMTMSASNEAVHWILTSLIHMTPEVKELVEGMLSDLGEFRCMCDYISLQVCHFP